MISMMVRRDNPRRRAKQFNLISWNGREAKYDLRDWSPDGVKMGKGVTLAEEELTTLRGLLNQMVE
jgi:hypothetical protein